MKHEKATRSLGILCCILLSMSSDINAQGMILSGTSPDTPHASAILELESSTQGFIASKMTTSQRDNITSPAEGLMIYNTTTARLEYYGQSGWMILDSPTHITSPGPAPPITVEGVQSGREDQESSDSSESIDRNAGTEAVKREER